jgi:pantoate--beta-alanine ligase
MSNPPLPIVRTVRELRAYVGRWRNQNQSIGLAPTMGALHDGHMTLISTLRQRCHRTVASVFVNPRQFNLADDLAGYPRDEAGDAEKLAAAGCDLLFAPSVEVMYPEGHATTVTMTGLAEPLEGERRPGHFNGVCTVVSKLLLQCLPDAAAFGEKDYQQLMVVKRLVADLDMPIEIISVPTAREEDGLAMSSRNARLTMEERVIAGQLNVILRDCVARLEAGDQVITTLVKAERAIFKAGFKEIDYLALRGAEDFMPVASPIIRRPTRLLAAVTIGDVRLLDNFAIHPR